jgi:hypothetical protein
MQAYARIEDGRVAEIIAPMVDDDGNEIPIEQRFTAEFIAMLVPCDDTVQAGMTYDGSTFAEYVEPARSSELILADNTATRDRYLSDAAVAIAPLQDAVDLDIATDSETAALKLWKQ